MVGRKFGFRFASVSLGWSWGRVRFAPLLSVSGGMARTGAHCAHAAPQRAPRRPQKASRRPRTIPHDRGRSEVLRQVPRKPACALRAARRFPRGAGARGACRAPGAHVVRTCPTCPVGGAGLTGRAARNHAAGGPSGRHDPPESPWRGEAGPLGRAHQTHTIR